MSFFVIGEIIVLDNAAIFDDDNLSALNYVHRGRTANNLKT